jgi:prephenate dehydrogenase
LLKIKKMKIYIIGLIGGSMALDIKGLYPEATVYGVDTDEDHLQEALALGVVDAQIENLSDADFVIPVPVDVALTLLPRF